MTIRRASTSYDHPSYLQVLCIDILSKALYVTTPVETEPLLMKKLSFLERLEDPGKR